MGVAVKREPIWAREAVGAVMQCTHPLQIARTLHRLANSDTLECAAMPATPLGHDVFTEAMAWHGSCLRQQLSMVGLQT